MMFEIFQNMYVTMRDDPTVDHNNPKIKTLLHNAEQVLRKHGKDPAALQYKDPDFVKRISSFGER